MSRYDYPDPGTDPAYCDPLAAEDDSIPLATCLWCGQVMTCIIHEPYCSSQCAIEAEEQGVA